MQGVRTGNNETTTATEQEDGFVQVSDSEDKNVNIVQG